MADDFDFSWMIGKTISAVAFSEPTLWSFSFGERIGIGAECPWRLLKNGRVEISSEDHLQQYGLPAPLDAAAVAADALRHARVVSADAMPGTADLVLEFTGSRRLEFIPFSSGYESWGVTTPSGWRVIALGGGDLSGWQDHP